jgi:hypothetical protein
MTLQEFCKKYDYQESTVIKTFPQVQSTILKRYGIQVIKVGRGKKAQYIEKEMSDEDQLKDLHEFLKTHPAIKEYFEGIEG